MADRPNIILIMTDQQRADQSAREGFPLDTTPFLDALAAQGTWFNRAYTSTPQCAPARTSLLTGRYPSATRVRTNHNLPDAVYEKDLWQVLREAGYKVGLCGKNHSHTDPDTLDFGLTAGHLDMADDDDDPQTRAFAAFLKDTHFHMWKEATPFPPEVQFPYRLVDKAMGWIDTLADPYFLWLSIPEPHNPFQVPEPYFSMFPPEELPANAAGAEALAGLSYKYQWCRDRFIGAFPDFVDQLPRARANYLGQLRMIDDQIRRLHTWLDDTGRLSDTIVIFMSDHGDFVGEYGLMRKGPDLSEALTRIPLSFTGPGIRASATPHDAHVSLTDLFPTICDIAEANCPISVQGRSLWPLLAGADDGAAFSSAYAESGMGGSYRLDGAATLDPRDDGFTPSPDGVTWGAYDCLNSWTQAGQVRMVRKGDWKLVADMEGTVQLYHLPDDPSETVNLAGRADHAHVQADLTAELVTWMLRVQDPLPLPRTRYELAT